VRFRVEGLGPYRPTNAAYGGSRRSYWRVNVLSCGSNSTQSAVSERDCAVHSSNKEQRQRWPLVSHVALIVSRSAEAAGVSSKTDYNAGGGGGGGLGGGAGQAADSREARDRDRCADLRVLRVAALHCIAPLIVS
jgi:hypothetical protein